MKTWGDVKNEVLGLMFSNNTGGTKVSVEDQSVQEYVMNMPDAFNCAMHELSRFCPEKAKYEVVVTQPYSEIDLSEAIEDFISVSENEVYYKSGDAFCDLGNYDIQGESVFIPHDAGTYRIWYEKEPSGVFEDTSSDTELEISEDILSAAAYFMAHRLYLEDDIQIAMTYYNIFEGMKSELREYYEKRSGTSGGAKSFYSAKGWV